MLAEQHLYAGLALAHLAWLVCYACGAALRGTVVRAATAEEALLDAVTTSVTGMAVIGFATYAAGLLGLLYPATAVAGVVAIAIAWFLRGRAPTRAAYWRNVLGNLAKAAVSPVLFVWILALVIAVLAIPPDAGSDATFYYDTLSFDWAHAHRLVVDPWLRLPYTTNDWPLILTWAYVLRIEDFAPFVNWLATAMMLVLTYAFSAWGAARVRRDAGMASVRLFALIATCTLGITPIFLHFVAANMIDVPSALFFTAACSAAIRACVAAERRHVVDAVVCAGFLVGLKVSFFALLPLFAALVVIALRANGAGRRTILTALAVTCVLSSPWYAESFILDGDPVAPVLNLRFQHKDAKWSESDMRAQLEDLKADTSPLALLAVPLEAFRTPQVPSLRDWGLTAAGACYPIAGIVLAFTLVRRRRMSLVPLTAAAIVYAVAYWELTSYLLRYALLFQPLLLALIAMLFAAVTRSSRALRWAAVPVLVAAAIPSPGSYDALNTIWITNYRLIAQIYNGPKDWLEQRAPAYSSIQYLCRTMHGLPVRDDRVYVVMLSDSQLFFKECGVQMIGDAFGPERFSDLGRAVVHDRIDAWAQRLRVGAMLLPSYAEDVPYLAGTTDELQSRGWKHIYFPQSEWEVFLAPATVRALDARSRSRTGAAS